VAGQFCDTEHTEKYEFHLLYPSDIYGMLHNHNFLLTSKTFCDNFRRAERQNSEGDRNVLSAVGIASNGELLGSGLNPMSRLRRL
jgi:hypothetical protein